MGERTTVDRVLLIVAAFLMVSLLGIIGLLAFDVIEPENSPYRSLVDVVALLIGFISGSVVERERTSRRNGHAED